MAKKLKGSSADVLKWGSEAANKNYAHEATFYFFLKEYLGS